MNSNKYSVIIITLFLITHISAYNRPIPRRVILHKLKQYNFIQCLPSTIMSSLVGVVTGGLSRYVEKEVEVRIMQEEIVIVLARAVIWWLENYIRHSCIEILQHNCDESGIPYKKNLMYFSSWISSWTSYIYLATDENKDKLYKYVGLSG